MTQTAQEARELLQWWLDYYDGARTSAGLKEQTKSMISNLSEYLDAQPKFRYAPLEHPDGRRSLVVIHPGSLDFARSLFRIGFRRVEGLEAFDSSEEAKAWAAAQSKRYIPTPEETFRMENDCG